MRMGKVLSAAFIAGLCVSGMWTPLARGGDLADVMGVTHVDGKYFLTHKDFLDEGADQVLATGSRTIKVYLMPGRYPWNSNWPKEFKSLVEIAQSPYYKSLFAKPFHTYILTVYSMGRGDHYWTAGVTPKQMADETRQFHDLAKYLLATYQGTGKTFVLQNWEGDWGLRDTGGHVYDIPYTPTQTSIDGMIQWINARQAGINQARAEVKTDTVHVYGAVECNRVDDTMKGRPGVANSVLPHTTVDLASYSSYDTLDSAEHLGKAVDFISAHLPKTAVLGQSTRSVYLGEYGWPENEEGPGKVNRVLNTVFSVVKSRQLAWAVYWEVYCNEPKVPTTQPLNGREHDASLRGFWMVKPDATPGMAWHRYRRLLATADPHRATASAIKKDLALLFEDRFSRPDGTDIGPGWKQDAHYGPISGKLEKHRLVMTIADGSTVPWTSAELNLKDPAVLGRGLEMGEYIECTLRRLSPAGDFGVEFYNSDQLRQGSHIDAGPSPLLAWTGAAGGWVPFSVDDQGNTVKFDWNSPHTLGVRLDSADGSFATVSYYLDGNYVGSWLFQVGSKTADWFGFFAQSKTNNSSFEFTSLKIFGRRTK